MADVIASNAASRVAAKAEFEAANSKIEQLGIARDRGSYECENCV